MSKYAHKHQVWNYFCLIFFFNGLISAGESTASSCKRNVAWYELSAWLQTYCHLSTNKTLSVSWQFSETCGLTNYGRKDAIPRYLVFGTLGLVPLQIIKKERKKKEKEKTLGGSTLVHCLVFSLHFSYVTFINPLEKIWLSCPVKATAATRTATRPYQCVQYFCVQAVVWLPVFGIFSLHTDVDACDCTWQLYKLHTKVCSWSWLWEKNPSLRWGIKPVIVLCLPFWSDSLQTSPCYCSSTWNIPVILPNVQVPGHSLTHMYYTYAA